MADELRRVPADDVWDDLADRERARRVAVLATIRRRIELDGPRVAVPAAERGRLFMPFSALKGYEDLTHNAEDQVAGESEEAWGVSGHGRGAESR